MTNDMERAMRERSERLQKAINAQSDILRAQMRSNRWWTVGTTVAGGLALAGLIICRLG